MNKYSLIICAVFIIMFCSSCVVKINECPNYTFVPSARYEKVNITCEKLGDSAPSVFSLESHCHSRDLTYNYDRLDCKNYAYFFIHETISNTSCKIQTDLECIENNTQYYSCYKYKGKIS